MEVFVHNQAELEELARHISQKLRPGDVLALSGDLAAGKTTFTQALMRALGYDQYVSSPTFVIEQRYPLTGPVIRQVIHLDLYRLEPRDLPHLDWNEYLHSPDSVTIVEWPEKAEQYLPKNRKLITIEIVDEKTRRFQISDNLSD